MIQQRKSATYGKSSRKQITDFSAFANASEPNKEHIHHKTGTSRAPSAQDAGMRTVQCSASPWQLPEAMRDVSEFQSYKASTPGRAQKKDMLYDFPSTDEDTERNESVADTGSRKKRRVTPKDDILLTSVAFDDDSLQRHIAAEVRRESKMAASTADKAAEDTEVQMTYVRDKPEVSTRKKPSPTKNSVPTSVRSGGLIATLSVKTTDSKAPVAKKAFPPRLQDNRMAVPKISPSKIPGHNRKKAQPRRDSYTPPKDDFLPTLPILSVSGQTENKGSQKGQDLFPFTPQKPRSRVVVTTTPKQRELWGKLLSTDTQETSPESLKLPGLCIANQMAQSQNQTTNSSMRIMGRDASTKPGKRSAKLVDFLTTSDGDGSASERNLSEDCDSSGVERSKSTISDVSINDEILTTQTSPSTGSQNKRPQLQGSGLAHLSQPIPSLPGVPKVTYIRERTHLGDDDLNDAVMLDAPFVTDTVFSKNPQRGASGLPQRQQDPTEAVYDGSDDIEDSQGAPMRSIHELREAGGNTRLVGQLEATLDDLDERIGSSISARRSSLLSLASKLLEPSACRMFTDRGLEPRLLAQLNFGHDIIERSLLAASILQILLNTTTAAFHSQISLLKTTNLLVGLLGDTQDLTKQAKLRETNMSKQAQSEYTTFCMSFLRSPAWRTSKPPMLSGQILALQCLDLLVRQAREGGYLAEILSPDAIDCIAETFFPFPGSMQPQKPYSRTCLELAVSILESSTISGTAQNRDAEWTDTTLERVSGIFPFLGQNSSHECGSLQTLTLRLYLNLTNASPRVCETFSKPHIVNAVFRTMFLQFEQLSNPKSQHQEVYALDHLVLSLGCLINLAESSEAMRRLVVDLKMKERSYLEILLQLFVKKRRKVAEVGLPQFFWEHFADYGRRIPRRRLVTMLHLDISLCFSAISASTRRSGHK